MSTIDAHCSLNTMSIVMLFSIFIASIKFMASRTIFGWYAWLWELERMVFNVNLKISHNFGLKEKTGCKSNFSPGKSFTVNQSALARFLNEFLFSDKSKLSYCHIFILFGSFFHYYLMLCSVLKISVFFSRHCRYFVTKEFKHIW